jgi:chromosome partitioning protein
MSVIAVYNMKGGVGKTTAAINLSYLCAAAGERTLLWDLDAQAASSFAFRVRPHVVGFRRTSLQNPHVFAEAIKQTDYDGLDLLPADFAYRKLDRLLGRLGKPERVIGNLLADLARGYDTVLLDCPPGMSLLTEGVFAAADIVLAPTIPTVLSLRTLAQLIAWTERGDRAPAVVAFLNMVDRRKALHRRTSDWSTRHPELFLAGQVGYSTLVEQMTVRRMPLSAFAPDDSASAAFASIRTEVLSRLRRAGELESLPSSAPALLVREIESLIAGIERAGREEAIPPPPHAAEWASAGVQVVHRFDTDDRGLERRGYALELEERSGIFRLVVARADSEDAEDPQPASRRVQVQIDARWATEILSGQRSPLDAIERRSRQPLPPMVRDVRTIIRERPLGRVDSRLAERTWADGDRRGTPTDGEGLIRASAEQH